MIDHTNHPLEQRPLNESTVLFYDSCDATHKSYLEFIGMTTQPREPLDLVIIQLGAGNIAEMSRAGHATAIPVHRPGVTIQASMPCPLDTCPHYCGLEA